MQRAAPRRAAAGAEPNPAGPAPGMSLPTSGGCPSGVSEGKLGRARPRLSRIGQQLHTSPAAAVAAVAAASAADAVFQRVPPADPAVCHPRRFAATDSVEAQASFFQQHGYCFVSGALAGAELLAAQGAYQRHAGPTRAAWQRAVAAGTRTADVGTYGNTSGVMKVDLGPPCESGRAAVPATAPVCAQNRLLIGCRCACCADGEVDVKNLPDHSWDIPRVAELDDAFVRLAEPPNLMPLLFEVSSLSATVWPQGRQG